MEPKTQEKAVHGLAQVVRAFSSEVAGLTYALMPIFEREANKISEEIAMARAMNLEGLPPVVVRYWVAAKDILASEGYMLTFGIRDWYANRAYQSVVVTPKREGDIFGKPPIVVGFIISKNTRSLATRAEITEALKSHYHPELVDYEDHQIHGLEVLVNKNMLTDVPDRLGIETLNAFQNALQRERLLLRRVVAHGYRSYGGEAIVLYQPKTAEEAKEFKPPMSHVALQEKNESGRFLEELNRYHLLQRLTGILRTYIVRTQ